MRFASRLFRRNFLFALLYTLISSERMIRGVWHDLNSTWTYTIAPETQWGTLKEKPEKNSQRIFKDHPKNPCIQWADDPQCELEPPPRDKIHIF